MSAIKNYILTVVCVVLSVSGLGAQEDEPEGPQQFDGYSALAYTTQQVTLGPRPAGTPALFAAGNLIQDTLSGFGWEVREDWHFLSFGPEEELSADAQETLADWQPITLGPTITSALNERGEVVMDDWENVEVNSLIVPVRNLEARSGSGPVIILAAHYDTRIYADNDDDSIQQREPTLGANDAGSGVGVLLELARVISEHYTLNAELRFVFFDAEDNGRIAPWSTVLGGTTNGWIVGSSLYAEGLNPEDDPVQLMILVDMVGDAEQRILMEGYSLQSAPTIVEDIWQVAADLGYGRHFIPEARSPITDDHVPFLQRGIPAVDIIDLDYPYWHTTEDTLENVSPESLERVGRVLQVYLEQIGAITPNQSEE